MLLRFINTYFARGAIGGFLILSFLLSGSLPRNLAQAATFTITPTADAFVDQAAPGTNFGTHGNLRTRSVPAYNSYLKFNVSGLGGAPITEARFEIYANGSNPNGFEVRSVSDTSWGETSIHYNNAPSIGNLIVSSGSHGGARYISVDVSSYITHEGTYSFVMTTTNNNYRSYPSKELGSNPPRLVITTGTGGPAVSPTPSVSPMPTSSPSVSPSIFPTPVPTATPGPSTSPLPSASPGLDFSDALLLYNVTKTNSHYGMDKVIKYYGLIYKEVNLATTALTDSVLRDEAGTYFKTVFIDGSHLTALDSAELTVLKNAVVSGGTHLIVPAFRVGSSTQMQTLTSGEIVGSADIADTSKEYIVSKAATEITREFSGLTIKHPTDPKDFKLVFGSSVPHVTILALGTDSANVQYPLFARYQNGNGSIFVVSNYADAYLKNNLLRENWTNKTSGTTHEQQWFSQITPLMMFVKYTAGNEAWHNNHNYANFTLDDPPFVQKNGTAGAGFNYLGILQEAQAHNFHFTLGLPPGRSDEPSERDPQVIAAFRDNPAYLSVNIHGNNHDGYEFYKYNVSDQYPARPEAEQVTDINQGLSRMSQFTLDTQIPVSYSMIFPYNISPAKTLAYLKQKNFQMTINSADVPLGETKVRTWDSYMYPLEMKYGHPTVATSNFGFIIRQHGGSVPYPFDLFLDRPAWAYEHQGVFDTHGIGWFSPIADQMNTVTGGLEWKSIGDITKKLYLEKLNDDGTMDLRFFGNNIVVTNETGGMKLYHLRREEVPILASQNISNQPVIIKSVTLDGVPVAYTVSGGWLQVDTAIPAGASQELKVTYGP